jgi:acyl-CoA reductase-like NAD-dependent aldehyde dehydrogenase
VTSSPVAARSPLVIDGAVREGSDYFETRDPATASVLGEIARGTPADVDDAVAAARRAFDPWRRTRPVDRGRILLAVSAAITEHRNAFAELESLDTGKPLKQARADVDVAARYFEFYAGAVDKILGTTIPLGDDFLDYTIREPLGVSAQIIPWNYPMQIGCRGLAAALAAGNTVVAKPAAEASLTLIKLAQLVLEAGLPPGVLNLVPGHGSEVGAALAAHEDVNQVTFTGSVEVGTQVMAAAARTVVPVVLELGGKSPNIVFADADLDAALPVILNSILQNAGQTCSAGARLLVHGAIADEVLSRLGAMMEAVRIGPGIEDPDLGPLISAHQLERVGSMVDDAVEEGAELVTGGKAAPEAERYGGFFYAPTIVVSRPDAAIARDEVFGPVIAAVVFDTDEEAIALANGTEYGLVTGVWTTNVTRAHRVAREIGAGQIYVNGYGAGGGVELPFGGYGKSGFGREKGLEGLSSYLQTKNVCVRLS